jgi:hypothetical protein
MTIYLRYGTWFLGISLACLLWSSSEMWTYSVPLFGLSSLLLYRKKDFKTKLSNTDLFITFGVVTILIVSSLFGWTEMTNKKWEHFMYRSYVAVAGWLALTGLGLRSLNKELRTNLTNAEKK